MTIAGTGNGPACGEVYVALAVLIHDPRSFGRLNGNRVKANFQGIRDDLVLSSKKRKRHGRSLRLSKLVFFKLVVQVLPGDTKLLTRSGDVPLRFRQSLLNHKALKPFNLLG